MADDFRVFAAERLINAADAAETLNCSRQYINELVKTGKLHPIKAAEKHPPVSEKRSAKKKLAMNAASATAVQQSRIRLCEVQGA